jgi:hypothetical protein
LNGFLPFTSIFAQVESPDFLRGHFGINAERLRRGVGWSGQM